MIIEISIINCDWCDSFKPVRSLGMYWLDIVHILRWSFSICCYDIAILWFCLLHPDFHQFFVVSIERKRNLTRFLNKKCWIVTWQKKLIRYSCEYKNNMHTYLVSDFYRMVWILFHQTSSCKQAKIWNKKKF